MISKDDDSVVFNGVDVGGSLSIVICEWIQMEMNLDMFRDYELNTELDLILLNCFMHVVIITHCTNMLVG